MKRKKLKAKAVKRPKSPRGPSRKPAKRTKKAPPKREVELHEPISGDVVFSPPVSTVREQGSADRSRRSSNQLRELSWMEFDRLVQSMAMQVGSEFKPEAVVGVAHGGVFVGGALAKALRVEFYPVRISRRSRDSKKRAGLNMSGSMPRELKGQRVLVVDDVAASGETLELAMKLAERAGAREVKTLALLAREEGFMPHHVGWVSDEFVVFPWDYEEVTDDARFDIDVDTVGV